MSFAVVVELASAIAFAVILLGGRQKREAGWKVLGWLLGVAAAAQLLSMAVVVRYPMNTHTHTRPHTHMQIANSLISFVKA